MHFLSHSGRTGHLHPFNGSALALLAGGSWFLVMEPESWVIYSRKIFRQRHLGAMVPFSPSVEEVISGLQRHRLLTPMVLCFVNSNHDSAFSFDGTRARKSVYSALSPASGRKSLLCLRGRWNMAELLHFTREGEFSI